jgi:hypothetical protein
MGTELPHTKVKLVVPILFSDLSIFNRIVPELVLQFGETDYTSEIFPFKFTSYYDDEMSGDIFRVFLSFHKLIAPEDLVDIKKNTNRIELEHSDSGNRRVNLDPGYLELGKFVLATTKDQQHRLYIRDGIYEEITLFYRAKQWRDWEWTYPDYRSEKYKTILTEIREIYRKQVKSGEADGILQPGER